MTGLTRLKFAVMAPFILFVVLLGLGLSAAQYFSHVRESQRASAQTAAAIVGGLNGAVLSETEMMAGMLAVLAERTDLSDAFRRHDMERLLTLTAPGFARMKADQGITHFYFTDPRRVNQLRVHQPPRHGDTINRPSTLRAEATQALASGIELGPLGTLTLRVVRPWRVNGELLGYLELGTEIDGLFERLKQQFGLEPLVFLAKARLNRQGWEDGMRMLGRTPNWDLLPDRVMAVGGETLPAADLVRLRAHPDQELELNGRWLTWVQLPLGELAGNGDFDVGAVLDVTSRRQEIHDFAWLVIRSVVLGSAVIIALFWLVLDRVEEKLRQTEGRERRLGRILNLLRDRIHIFEPPSLRMLDGNAMALAQVGGPDGTASARFDTVFADMEREPVEALDKDAKTITQEGQAIETNGTLSPVETRFTFVDDGPRPVVVAVSTDIGDRKLAERQLRTLWLALEQSPVSVMITNAQTQIEYVNPAFTKLSGYAANEIKGHTPRVLKSGKTSPDTYRQLWETLDRGEAWNGEMTNRRKGGQEYLEHAMISPVRDDHGRVVAYLAVKEDVTERKRHQQELAEMTAALTRSNTELEQFAYVASHDLRQPLRMIAGYMSLIQRRIDPMDDELATFFDFAISGAKRMDALILALLDYSRIGAVVDSEPVDTAALVGELLQQNRLALDESGATITVEGECPALVSGVRSELQRLFDNLIGNALKYRRADLPPLLRIGWRRQDDDWLCWIADNGIGMAPDQCERAFGMFQRLVDGNQYEGTGIGLAVCRKIVERHGGRIWCESRLGEGTTFWFTLPQMRETTEPLAP